MSRVDHISILTIVAVSLCACAVEPGDDGDPRTPPTTSEAEPASPEPPEMTLRMRAGRPSIEDGSVAALADLDVNIALTHGTVLCLTNPPARGSWFVDVCWGFDYNPANTHVRGYGLMDASDSRTHVQFEPLNGDLGGVLHSVNGNSQVGFLELETAAENCRAAGTYVANLHYSIRWPDGTPVAGQTGQLSALGSVICI